MSGIVGHRGLYETELSGEIATHVLKISGQHHSTQIDNLTITMHSKSFLLLAIAIKILTLPPSYIELPAAPPLLL